MAINVALIGFGTVGEAVYRLIHDRQKDLKRLLGTDVRVTDVVVKNGDKQRNIRKSTRLATNFNDIFLNADIDVVIEAIVDVEPGFTILSEALKRKIPVITANKMLFAHKRKQLESIANQTGKEIGYEATVCGGIPLIRTITELLHVNQISKVEGVLNGTANYILSDMRENQSTFECSLEKAQKRGYAELDPAKDINGTDAFYKIMILCETVFGHSPNWDDVTLEGITRIRPVDVEVEALRNKRFKLIATAEKDEEGSIRAQVSPQLVDSSHPLYGVEGAQNAVTIHTDLLGSFTLEGPGAGGFPTASAILSDLLGIFQRQSTKFTYKHDFAKRNVAQTI